METIRLFELCVKGLEFSQNYFRTIRSQRHYLGCFTVVQIQQPYLLSNLTIFTSLLVTKMLKAVLTKKLKHIILSIEKSNKLPSRRSFIRKLWLYKQIYEIFDVSMGLGEKILRVYLFEGNR